MSSKKEPDLKPETPKKGFSRRGFLHGAGAAGGVLGSGILEQQAEAAPAAAIIKPGETSITLNVNGKAAKVNVEPRTTLCDALRDRLDTTGAKRVCDRGTCGACTVLMNGKVVYSCTVLAVDAVGKQIQTIEALTTGSKAHPIVAAFVNHDGMQCGYCTSGFVMASKALLDKHPKPSEEQIKAGLGGNLCRCGTYVGVKKAVMEASAAMKGGSNA